MCDKHSRNWSRNEAGCTSNTLLDSQTHFQSFSLLTAFYNYITRKAGPAFYYLCIYIIYIKSRPWSLLVKNARRKQCSVCWLRGHRYHLCRLCWSPKVVQTFCCDQHKVHAILQNTGDALRHCRRSRSWSDVQSYLSCNDYLAIIHERAYFLPFKMQISLHNLGVTLTPHH